MNSTGITELVTGIIVALGGVKIIPMIFKGIKAHRNNRAREERAENRTLLGRAKYAEARAEREADYRRRIETWAGRLEYMLAKLGVPQDKIPTKPEPGRIKETAS
jgi:hypothetical protein